MSDFFRELEEDIREERIIILWHKYGNYLIGLALAIVLVTAGYSFWKYWKTQHQLKGHISFSQAVNLMKQGKKNEALSAFQAIAKDGGGYGKLAQLYEASLLPNPEEVYTKIAQENASDPALGNLPTVLMGERMLSSQKVLNSLESLAAPNNAWAALSLELLGLADLKRGDDVKAAEKYVRILKERYITSSEKMRAGLMLSQLDIPPSLLTEELEKEAQQ